MDLDTDDGLAPGGLLHTVMLAPAARSRSGQGKPERVLADLLHDVLAGLLTPGEAAAAYGAHPAHGRRRFASFGAYLNDRIAYATDAAVEQQLRDLLARSACWTRDKRQARSAITKHVNRLLAETGREHAARLRELRDELAGGAVA